MVLPGCADRSSTLALPEPPTIGVQIVHGEQEFLYFQPIVTGVELTMKGRIADMWEKTGRSEERIELPQGIITVKDLIGWLRTRGPEFEQAFAKPEAIRTALDRAHVKADTAIAGAREIGFFPPVTGG